MNPSMVTSRQVAPVLTVLFSFVAGRLLPDRAHAEARTKLAPPNFCCVLRPVPRVHDDRAWIERVDAVTANLSEHFNPR
jgi:hypothetical protein